ADDLDGFEIVRAPYLGTFYRAPKPGEAAYVEIGAEVSAESELCLVEVMKLFTAVRAGASGTIAHILATDGQMVEAGQPLFAIDAKG
ncbi:acetyl-CoA carboxylase, biotin carboxyl carrier protein, partial [Nostoc sp. 3335mG]